MRRNGFKNLKKFGKMSGIEEIKNKLPSVIDRFETYEISGGIILDLLFHISTLEEKGKRDREKVTEVLNHVLPYTLPYLAERKLRKLLEEI